jgi:hypothetical protein
MFGLPKEGVFYFGVPRWLFRELLTRLAKWLFALDKRRRFHHKLRVYRSVGNIAESYRLSHRGSIRFQPDVSSTSAHRGEA